MPLNVTSFTKLLLPLATLLSMGSCRQKQEQQPIPLRSDYTVSLQEATVAARHSRHSTLIRSLSNQPKKNSIPQQLLDVIPIPDHTNPLYYIFNYKNGGYLILAADKRVEPVLAYSTTGRYRKGGTLPQGLTSWLFKNYENMQRLQRLPALRVPAIVARQWQELLADSIREKQPASSPTARVEPEQDGPPCEDYYNTTLVEPLLLTTWGQGCTYNDFCDPGNADCGRMPTGCVATALAQVMYYYQQPAYFSWANMTTTMGNSDVAYLMRQAGQAVGMHYSETGSDAPTRNLGSALRDTYGYRSVTYGDYDYNSVRANLNARQPVVLQGFTDYYTTGFFWWQTEHPTGTGHAWVCDGYQDTYWQSCDCSCGGTYSMLHMNWGWNEWFTSDNYNGWYRESDWTVARTDRTLNFQYFKEMVYNIKP